MQPASDTDRYVIEQLQPVLRPGERIVVCAYLVPPIEGGKVGVFIKAATAMAAFAAITSERLLLLQTRIGAFAPLLENHGLVSLERAQLKGAHAGSKLLIEHADGRIFEFQNNRASRHVSTQKEFFERIESTFGRSEAAVRRSTNEKLWKVAGAGIGIALAVGYVLYRLHGR
jgi:hypothetical protein